MNVMKEKFMFRLYISMLVFILMPFQVINANAEGKEQVFQKISEYVERAMVELRIPGASLAIVHEGEVALANAWGVTGGEKSEVTVQTPFLIGSNSKAITAYAIMLLVEQGMIDLKKPVQDYLPWFTLSDEVVASDITIEHLLSHSSGLSSFSGFSLSDRGSSEFEAIQENVRVLANDEPIFYPGEGYEYSAANYAILGAVIEEVTGSFFSDFVHNELFGPLDMKFASASVQQAIGTGWEAGYRSWFDIPIASPNRFDNGGAPYGYIAASAQDMAQFIIALQNPGQVLSQEHTDLLLEPLIELRQDYYYGFGWRLSNLENGDLKIWHSGSTTDFRSEMFMIPELEVGVVLLTNRNNSLEEIRLHNVSTGIEKLLYGLEPGDIVRSTPIERSLFYVVVGFLLLVSILFISKLKRQTVVKHRWRWGGVGVLFGLLAVSFFPLFINGFSIPFQSFWLFVPDLALLSIGVVGLLILNAIFAFILSKRGGEQNNC
ncbi:serine hydrolase [Alkalihalobacillus hemicellulosilyticus]|uniref:Beta-lactamase-related domain-containing protein n=1 Tax=Halalkalibacter hemicellulosilyticusJCM 9152 TaxID=1236971 RepID=W4QEN0_9BACI|nr:serine hydrolase [Halalkalibacter hemicellulosilyticus]GAE30506.1 hypothetical protein JCM9152_1914 [Halalkalibacter hemicellulosilyticusJCM 9152]